MAFRLTPQGGLYKAIICRELLPKVLIPFTLNLNNFFILFIDL